MVQTAKINKIISAIDKWSRYKNIVRDQMPELAWSNREGTELLKDGSENLLMVILIGYIYIELLYK